MRAGNRSIRFGCSFHKEMCHSLQGGVIRPLQFNVCHFFYFDCMTVSKRRAVLC